MLETTSNNLDPDFDWSSLRFGRLFFPNLGDLKKKKRSSLKLRQFFCPNLGNLKKKRSSSWLKARFFGRYHIRFFTNSHRQYHWGGGGLFPFLVQKSASKVLETGCFVFSSGQWGSSSPPAPPGYSTVLRKEDENVIVKALKFEVSCSRGRPTQT